MTTTKSPTFFCLCAIPGAGKSTYATLLRAKMPEAAYICPDVIRAQFGDVNDQSHNYHIFSVVVPSLISKAASEDRDIIYDATNVTMKNRAGVFEKAKSFDYRIEVHVLQVTLDECLKRNAAREKIVPESVIRRMDAQFQFPDKRVESEIDEIVLVPSV